jgi:hypothetical protein
VYFEGWYVGENVGSEKSTEALISSGFKNTVGDCDGQLVLLAEKINPCVTFEEVSFPWEVLFVPTIAPTTTAKRSRGSNSQRFRFHFF